MSLSVSGTEGSFVTCLLRSEVRKHCLTRVSNSNANFNDKVVSYSYSAQRIKKLPRTVDAQLSGSLPQPYGAPRTECCYTRYRESGPIQRKIC